MGFGRCTTISSPIPEVLVSGDFKLPHSIWPEGTAGLRSTRDEQTMKGILIKYVANDLFLIQRIELTTHRKVNTLDLVFSNDPFFVHSQESLDTMYSDHNIVECATICVIQMVQATPRMHYLRLPVMDLTVRISSLPVTESVMWTM